MVSIVVGGAIATIAVIALGVLVALPPFIQPTKGPSFMLMFNVVKQNNAAEDLGAWCNQVAETLNRNNVHAAVFVTGVIAEQYPTCVTSFDNGKVDIGSSTYDYVSLPSIMDYSEQLKEVINGKKAVDQAGNLDSKLFRAPYGKTDQNIYSLLTRAGILADFSYSDHYNKYYQDKFIWFKASTYNASSLSDEDLRKLQNDKDGNPIIIDLDNNLPPQKISSMIQILNDKKVHFLNPTELTGMNLTTKEGQE